MPVQSPSPIYEHWISSWLLCRDAVDGEKAIKDRGSTYLPQLDGDTKEQYESYKLRAVWYGATSRTVAGLTGAVFRSAPTVTVPELVDPDLKDLTLCGDSLATVGRLLLTELLTTGRVGLLVDHTSTAPPGWAAPRPYWVTYRTEEILSWRVVVDRGVKTLVEVRLRETAEEVDPEDPWSPVYIPQIRVLELADGRYQQRLYRLRKKADQQQATTQVGALVTGQPQTVDGTWEPYGEPVVPLKAGQPLDFIPFVFGSTQGVSPEVDRPPLLDLAMLNVSHYRTSADWEHGAHLTALPTPYVSGVEKGDELRIGARVAWVLPETGASAGMLEYKGQGLGALEKLSDRKERLMAALGARLLLSEPMRQAETAETARIKASGESVTLSGCADTLDLLMSRALRWHVDWSGVPSTEDPRVAVNRDFIAAGLSPQAATALMQLWQAAAISYDTLFRNLQQGEVIEAGLTIEEELERIRAREEDLPKPKATPGGEGTGEGEPPAGDGGEGDDGDGQGEGDGDGEGDDE